MKTQTTKSLWRFGLMLALVCIWCMPQLAGAAPLISQVPTGPRDINGNWAVPDYYTTANWANSPPMAKFVDTLPGLGAGKKNNLGQYLSVAKPDTVTYPGSDYYEIDLIEYREQMHSDLPPTGTLLRGYVQVNKGTDTASCGGQAQPACSAAFNTLLPDPVHYLGPTIVAQRDRPVRIKFNNRLPVGAAGDLFIPVDTTIMGAGSGPASQGAARGQGANCDNTIEPNSCAHYTQNRATLHLHGGRTPWISDGTPHQWTTPASENTPYPQGVSVQNVPDMPNPGDGSLTFYYSNQQSARLMFYHDHAFGITRLNVYVGEAAGYVITDQYEQDLVTRGLIPPDQIPLIIQDKTFVDASEIRKYDPLWNWGSGTPDANGIRPPVEGDLWLPHVYMPAQNSLAGFGGVNPFGRWMYGPWFYPATAVTKGPVANPYYDPNCSSPDPAILATCTTPGQPVQIPGTPHPSMGMEAFQDSVVVNGTVFPTLTVDPRAYRFRILNAANDRFWNLSFYEADSDPANISPDPRLTAPDRSNRTEVKMLPASAQLAAANNWPPLWPVDGRDGGVPDPAFQGPSFLQIGTEGGFLPKPVIRAPQPVTYIIDPTAFWVGIVDQTGLALGPAERADVIVDFSAYAGKTLILYNDAPAAWPARVPVYDYFTGAPDMRDSGGYGAGGVYDPATGTWVGGHGVLPGYAPNTRTVMQVIVRPTVGTDPLYTFNPAALQAEFVPANPATPSLFAKAQEPIIVGQAAYQDVYPNSYFPANFPWEGISQINDNFLQFVTVQNTAAVPRHVVTRMEPKGIHDEMGASFDPVYGRMSGNLGMQLPNPTTLNALLILYGFADLPTETINNSTQMNVTVIPGTTSLADGTQIWKISHNGVDTHPIHFHIFDVQLINRVGWDGQIAYPEANELGWKDTVKISPLMDTIVAVRPRAPLLPFGITNSMRPLNPAIPLDSPMGFNSIDWQTGEAMIPAVTNILYDFKWEYVWHCHILSHEEMDMMRPIVLNVPSALPAAPTLNSVSRGGVLTWTDTTPATFGNPTNEIGFTIQRCDAGCGGAGAVYTNIGNALANATTYTDTSAAAATLYYYKVMAYNAAGSAASAARSVVTGSLVKPTVSISAPVDGSSFIFGTPIQINATASADATLTVAKMDFYVNGQLFRSDTTSPFSYTWVNAPEGTYSLTVKATDSNGVVSLDSLPVSITVLQSTAPASITVPTGSSTGNYTVSWAASSTPGVTYVLQESTTAAFTATTNIPVGAGGTALSVAITGKPDGSTFYYRVQAVSATLGNSAWVAGANGCVVSYPTIAPTAITVPLTSSNGIYTVSWSASLTPGATYTLEESTTANFSVGTTTVVASSLITTAQLISGKTNGIYYYRVKAVAPGYSTFPWATGANGCAVTLLPVIIAPAAGANITSGTPTVVSATVSPLAGATITRVDFYDNGVLAGTDAVAPYSTTWTPVVFGTHNLTVFAYYSNNSTYMSTPVTVTVLAANTAAITLDAPVAGSAFDLGTAMTVAATPSPVAGVAVILVEFYDGTAVIGYDLTAPYSFLYTPATAGLHSLSAKAYYGNGAIATSAAQSVTINGTVVAPASITVPASSATGAYTVSWTAAVAATAGATYTLEESTTAGFTAGTTTVVSFGSTATSAAISGKANGTYYYRVKAVKAPMTDSAWVSGATGCTVLLTAITTKAGVFRNGQWYLDMNGNGAWDSVIDAFNSFGIAGDVPVTGDWNGAGTTKAGVFRDGQWYQDMNGNGAWDPATDVINSFGIAGDVPVTGVWNGAGATKVGVFRNGQWYLDMNGNGAWDPATDVIYSFGIAGDVPVTGDWNGTGTTKVGVFRNGQWYLDMNGNGAWDPATDVINSFGIPGDKPVAGKW